MFVIHRQISYKSHFNVFKAYLLFFTRIKKNERILRVYISTHLKKCLCIFYFVASVYTYIVRMYKYICTYAVYLYKRRTYDTRRRRPVFSCTSYLCVSFIRSATWRSVYIHIHNYTYSRISSSFHSLIYATRFHTHTALCIFAKRASANFRPMRRWKVNRGRGGGKRS